MSGPFSIDRANRYARQFGRIEKAHGNAYAVCWGIGHSAASNERGFSNPYVVGSVEHVAFNHGADDCEAAA
jgi:hypothetical protein